MDKLKTKNIALDTDFIYANNITGGLMGDLGKNSAKGRINLFITDIVKKEVINQMREKIISAKGSLAEKLGKLSVLLWLPKYEPLFKLHVEMKEDLELLEQHFENWLQTSKVQIVPTSGVSVNDVFADYFNIKPPFEDKKDKKAEFPDAFSLHALGKYFKDRNELCYIIAIDAGVKRFQHESLILEEKPETILEKVAEDFESLEAIKMIGEHFKKEFFQVLEVLKPMIVDTVKDEVRNDTGVTRNQFDSEKVTIHRLTYVSMNVLSASSNQFTMSAIVLADIELGWSAMYEASRKVTPIEWMPKHRWTVYIQVHIFGSYNIQTSDVHYSSFTIYPFSILDQK